LIGSWGGNSEDYKLTPVYGDAGTAIKTDHPKQQYLSLVEIYDQNTGNTELKWCLTAVATKERLGMALSLPLIWTQES
jgi:hypothetical protein